MTKLYDVAIIGSGVAGTFAALRISEKYADSKTILIDIGKGPQKRKRALEGFLGCFPSGDGKLYPSDLEKVKDLTDGRKATPAYKWVLDKLESADKLKLTKCAKPKAELKKKIKELGLESNYLDYYQWKPKSIHALSRNISSALKENSNLTFSFENEVYSLRKNNNSEFLLETSEGSILSKKVILAAGRSGWRWVTNLFDDLNIISCDDFVRYGVRVEVPCKFMKLFNHSHMTLVKDNLEIGPLLWNGTIIQEDHSDLIISSFRSNEDRWKSEKVSFSLIKKEFIKDNGSVEADRIGKLACILFNDRVSKEKIRLYFRNQSQLNLIPEFSWLKEAYLLLEQLVPDIKRGSHYIPDIVPSPAKINVGSNLESEIEGLYVAGESVGIMGIISAAITGTICADSVFKE